MNERIKSLALQSMANVRFWNAEEESYEVEHDELTKFAELIVRECARIARATPCPYEDDEARQRLGHTWDMASIEAGRGIVKHFGVE